jgi:glycosyltransferase involved in cell wall biosynthesis
MAARRVAILSSVHLALDNRVFYREARTLARAGYDVTLIAVHDREEVCDGVHIRPLPRVPRWRRPLLWRRLLRMARETDADVFHVHDPELLLLTPRLRRLTGRPTVYDIHEANADFIALKEYLGPTRRLVAGLFRRLEPRLARGESALLFADDAIAADFASFTGPKATLYNFPGRELIDQGEEMATDLTDATDQSISSVQIRSHFFSEPIILYLGGLERNRGAALMIDAFAQVVADLPAARLLLVGHFMPPSLENEVRADAAARGIAHAVEIAGRVPFARVGDYLARAAVGWVTWQPIAKNRKNVPTKLFEYMAFGLPVVSSDLPSTRAFLPPEAGLLVTADDPTAHAAALLRLLRDPAGAARLGAAGRRLVETQYNWAAMEPRLLELYERL